jgi:prophage antirepressor-like protein
MLTSETRIAVFRQKNIRKSVYKNEWWFVIEDIIFALTDSNDLKQYVKRMKLRDEELAKG